MAPPQSPDHLQDLRAVYEGHMFEDVQVMGKSDLAKRLIGLVVSIVLHVVLIITVVIIPLVFFNVLPESELLSF